MCRSDGVLTATFRGRALKCVDTQILHERLFYSIHEPTDEDIGKITWGRHTTSLSNEASKD
jgi:hypothetical protein